MCGSDGTGGESVASVTMNTLPVCRARQAVYLKRPCTAPSGVAPAGLIADPACDAGPATNEVHERLRAGPERVLCKES
jgi:hypothetical protein